MESSIRINKNYEIITFVDDDLNSVGRTLNGIPINNFGILQKLSDHIDKVLIAIPSINPIKLSSLLKDLQSLGLEVLKVPSIKDIISKEEKIDELKPISVEDLLGRDSVQNL